MPLCLAISTVQYTDITPVLPHETTLACNVATEGFLAVFEVVSTSTTYFQFASLICRASQLRGVASSQRIGLDCTV